MATVPPDVISISLALGIFGLAFMGYALFGLHDIDIAKAKKAKPKKEPEPKIEPVEPTRRGRSRADFQDW